MSQVLLPPDIMPGGELFHQAFWELHTDRPIGMQVGSIPFTAILTYAQWSDITEAGEFDLFLACIRAMDRAYLEVRMNEEKGDSPTPAVGAVGLKSLMDKFSNDPGAETTSDEASEAAE